MIQIDFFWVVAPCSDVLGYGSIFKRIKIFASQRYGEK
jgi:hypothetical protein